ncbi:hypothetical protein GCM10009584_10350 [Ornithinimicrobium humiphilum]|uniref:Uncharacterized protein n=1 Tax=Ornithinimicrobium humiphilum TaxID=125288 RepID=A0A543KR68_9MICO|nr:hypothetical protein [Ornithinimicrobium humiphilum]TQM97544.1 hypothetical protein FB476_2457 [Ornithinimicrobium humiphilum]
MRLRHSLPILCAAATLAVTGCGSTDDAPSDDAAPSTAAAPTAAPATTADDADADPDPNDADDASADDAADAGGPVEAYLDWLAASREPDAPRACALMSEELQTRMLAELSAALGTELTDCEAMITDTAAMYAAAGSSAEVDVEVVTETSTEATLFATYLETGKCGTIHLGATATGWILTEQSEECAG